MTFYKRARKTYILQSQQCRTKLHTTTYLFIVQFISVIIESFLRIGEFYGDNNILLFVNCQSYLQIHHSRLLTLNCHIGRMIFRHFSILHCSLRVFVKHLTIHQRQFVLNHLIMNFVMLVQTLHLLLLVVVHLVDHSLFDCPQ
jgi:hypothetical protein